jgi:hypothetical protein
MLASTVAISSAVCFNSTWILWNAFGKESLLDSTAAVRVGKGCCPAWLNPKEARARKTFSKVVVVRTLIASDSVYILTYI